MSGLLARLGHWLGDRHHHPHPTAHLPARAVVPEPLTRICPTLIEAQVIRCPQCKGTAGRVLVGFEIDDQPPSTVYALAGCPACGWRRHH